MVYNGSQPAPLLPGETGMVKPPIKVQAAHPSMVLPTQARIDYRRLVEVGLVDVDSMHNLLAWLQPVRAEVEL